MKKLMLLGGLRYLIPVIKKAKELGYYVITCDYLPNNIAHTYSDEYHNVSIIDKEAVLELAQRLEINGILSFAVDPGVLTAAYIAEKMGLSSPPYASVQTLQNKGLFRQFLRDNDFNTPLAASFKTKEAALKRLSDFTFPVIVKPADSAGSKGVTKVNVIKELYGAIDIALANSISREFIIEEFIEALGYSTDCDSFSLNNEMLLTTFNNQYFDKDAANPYTPAGFSWPSDMSQENQAKLSSEIQRLVSLLNLGSSIYNIETRIGLDGKPYIMELSPRGGGNRLAEMINHVYGIDLIELCIKSAMGEEINKSDYKITKHNQYYAELIVHSEKAGIYDKIEISENYQAHIVELDMWVKKGDKVNSFMGANDAIGTAILRFDHREELKAIFERDSKLYNIKIKEL